MISRDINIYTNISQMIKFVCHRTAFIIRFLFVVLMFEFKWCRDSPTKRLLDYCKFLLIKHQMCKYSRVTVCHGYMETRVPWVPWCRHPNWLRAHADIHKEVSLCQSIPALNFACSPATSVNMAVPTDSDDYNEYEPSTVVTITPQPEPGAWEIRNIFQKLSTEVTLDTGEMSAKQPWLIRKLRTQLSDSSHEKWDGSEWFMVCMKVPHQIRVKCHD